MKPRLIGFYDSDTGRLPHEFEVIDRGAIDTGLLDANGIPLMKAPNPIGFVTNFEREKIPVLDPCCRLRCHSVRWK